MFCTRIFIPFLLSIFFLNITLQGQLILDFRFRTGVTVTHSKFDAQHDKIPQLVGHYNTVKYIIEQTSGEDFTFDEYLEILQPKKSFTLPTIFIEGNLELKQWPVYGLIGCGNSSYDYNSLAWWYGAGIGPRIPIGYEEDYAIIFNFEARRVTDNGFDEDAIIDSFGVNDKYKADMRAFFTAPNALGPQKTWLGYASLNIQRKIKGYYSVIVGPFLTIDFTRDVERAAGVNMSNVGIKAVFSMDFGSFEGKGTLDYFNPFSR